MCERSPIGESFEAGLRRIVLIQEKLIGSDANTLPSVSTSRLLVIFQASEPPSLRVAPNASLRLSGNLTAYDQNAPVP